VIYYQIFKIDQIKEHVKEAQTRDIDSLITGLLEKSSSSSSSSSKPTIIIEEKIDLFLENSSEYCFIIENKYCQEINGILLAALNVNSLNEIYKTKVIGEIVC
jgi:hypothetical protein